MRKVLGLTAAVAGLMVLAGVARGELGLMKEWQAVYEKAQVGVELIGGPQEASEGRLEWVFAPPREFTNAFDYLEVGPEGMREVAGKLKGIEAMSVGVWVYCRRTGEQALFCRQVPVVAADSERVFTPSDAFVVFLLGTDQHGFLMGNIRGNGRMPFPRVTLNEVFIRQWQQLVVVKDAEGHNKFYQNGMLVHTDFEYSSGGYKRPFRETPEGLKTPIRMALAQGGLLGEAWILPWEMTGEEVRQDFAAKKQKYPARTAVKPILLREMDVHPATDLWPLQITADNWPRLREEILKEKLRMCGRPPAEKAALDPQLLEEKDLGSYVRRKMTIAVEKDDRMVFYLLAPKMVLSEKGVKEKVPAILCQHGHFPTGKNCVVGIEGTSPGTPPDRNQAYAVDMAEAGMVALAPDMLRAGERMLPGEGHGGGAGFRKTHPDWNSTGKDVWDLGRAIDFLQTLPYVDGEKIGMTGHSYGGCGTVLTAALEPRIKVAVSNGPTAGGTYNHELAALIAPRPLLMGQAVGERRPREEEIYAALIQVYTALGTREKVYFHWYPGDHDYPPQARAAAVAWFKKWFNFNSN